MKTVRRKCAYWYIVALGASTILTFGGCGSGDHGGVNQGKPSREIRITSAIEAVGSTKSAANPNDALSPIVFLKIDALNAPQNMRGATNFYASRASGSTGAITFTDAVKPQYLITEQNAYFVAYYPGQPQDNEIVTWTITGRDDIMLTDIWNAGRYSAPLTGTGDPKLIFKHQLAQLEVICVADVSEVPLSMIQLAWGDIMSIELTNAYPQMRYSYASNKITINGTKANNVLLKPDYNTAFTSITIPAATNTSVNAAAMLAPSTGPLQLIVKTTNVVIGVPITVQLKQNGVNKDFEVGMRHTITLKFMPNANDIVIVGTSIQGWNRVYSGGSDVVI